METGKKSENEDEKTVYTREQYVELLREAWKRLQSWLKQKKFDPQSEADLQWFLCHCIVQQLRSARDIRAEFNHQQGFTDIVVAKQVFIETKYILRSNVRSPERWEKRKQIIYKDISKLRELRNIRPNIIGVLAILAENYDEDDKLWYKGLKEDCDRANIILLLAWKGPHPPAIRDVLELEEEQSGARAPMIVHCTTVSG